MTYPPAVASTAQWILRAIPLLVFGISLLSPIESSAQSRLRLKRTNQTSTPFSVILYGGFNGISDPSEKMQDMFEGTYQTSWGGILMGGAGLITIDTLWKPLSAGAEVYYQRMVSRNLAKRADVHYLNEEGEVNALETLWAYGVQALVAYDIHESAQILVGGGFQYIFSRSDVKAPVTGLFEPVYIPTAMVALNYRLLRYEHGSINGLFRGMKSFGEWGSIEFQSVLAFSFDF